MFNPSIDLVLIWIGILFAGLYALKVLGDILRLLRRRCPTNLLKKYGEGSWVVITGSSDGIGKGFAEQLAKRGFNLVLIARNKDKLEKVASELKGLNGNINIKIVIADFFRAAEPGFFDRIYDEIKELNISMLINNVGIGEKMGLLHDFSDSELNNMITVNCFPTILFTRKLINHFRARSHRSAIIQVSSTAAETPMAYASLYGATKIFEDHFSRSLQIEYPDIDMLSVRPGFVSTNMTYHRQSCLDTISPQECAEGALRELGRYERSSSHIKHEFLILVMRVTPSWIFNFILKNFLAPEELERRRVEREKLKRG